MTQESASPTRPGGIETGRRHFTDPVSDSGRWQGFELRSDDIVISTPPKCGTTWLQMIVGVLVFEGATFPRPLSQLSPWLDMRTRPRADVLADLATQEHRRFIKTHTPIDGLPEVPGVTYICVARDPRDVALSMIDHLDNMDMRQIRRLVVDAAAVEGLPAPDPGVPSIHRDQSIAARFWRWMEDDTPVEFVSSSLRRTVDHVGSFWERKGDDHIVLLHYADLCERPEDVMRHVAHRLSIRLPDALWPQLIHAVSFSQMRGTAASVAPSVELGFWRDPLQFFRSGRCGAWRDLLQTEGAIRRYEELVGELVSPEMHRWLHRS
jgi:aryl sulfotransferase